MSPCLRGVSLLFLAVSPCASGCSDGTPDRVREEPDPGPRLYTAYCSPCHGVDGAGTPNGPPPLLDSPWVAGSADRLVRIVLHGVHGSLRVADKVYDLEMPAFGPVLDDAKLSSLLGFARRQFASAGPVGTDAVRRVREQTAGRDTYWTAAELLEVP